MPDPLDLSVGVADLLAALTPPERDAVAAGALDPHEVWYEFITLEDDRVRPSHRALHGTVWRAGDPNAPVPPLDYGCRCSMRYVAPPGSQAAARNLLPPSPRPTPDTVPGAYQDFLKAEVSGLDLVKAAREAAKLPASEQVLTLVEAIQRADPSWTLGSARDLARMALQAVGRINPSRAALQPVAPVPLRPIAPPPVAPPPRPRRQGPRGPLPPDPPLPTFTIPPGPT